MTREAKLEAALEKIASGWTGKEAEQDVQYSLRERRKFIDIARAALEQGEPYDWSDLPAKAKALREAQAKQDAWQGEQEKTFCWGCGVKCECPEPKALQEDINKLATPEEQPKSAEIMERTDRLVGEQLAKHRKPTPAVSRGEKIWQEKVGRYKPSDFWKRFDEEYDKAMDSEATAKDDVKDWLKRNLKAELSELRMKKSPVVNETSPLFRQRNADIDEFNAKLDAVLRRLT